jgi:hypothetical protein
VGVDRKCRPTIINVEIDPNAKRRHFRYVVGIAVAISMSPASSSAILRSSWSSSQRWLLPGFDPDRAQQRCGRDHHQNASETKRDLHRKPIQDVDQRHVAGKR